MCATAYHQQGVQHYFQDTWSITKPISEYRLWECVSWDPPDTKYAVIQDFVRETEAKPSITTERSYIGIGFTGIEELKKHKGNTTVSNMDITIIKSSYHL